MKIRLPEKVSAIIRELKNAGYDGPVGIEFEGMEPVLEGIEAGVKNLRRFLEQVK